MAQQLEDIIEIINKAVGSFSGSLPAIQEATLESLMEDVKDLDVKNGNIASTVKNIRLLAKINSKLQKVIITPEYKSQVKDLLGTLTEITKLQNEYFKEQEVKQTAKKLNQILKEQTIDDTVEKLVGAGIGTNVAGKLTEILRSNITTGASYKSLTKQLKESLTDTETPGLLNRYVKQVVVDSVNQYSANHLQTLSADLGYKWYSYQGHDIETTRPFCNWMTDKRYFHIAEIPYMLQGEDVVKGETVQVWNAKKEEYEYVSINRKTGLPNGMIAGTDAVNFFVRRGGYNCGHQIFPVAESQVPQDVKDAFYAKFPDHKPQPKLIKVETPEQAKKVEAEKPAFVPSPNLTKSQQIIELHKAGKTNGEIVSLGFNASTVNTQVNLYKKSKASAGLPVAPQEKIKAAAKATKAAPKKKATMQDLIDSGLVTKAKPAWAPVVTNATRPPQWDKTFTKFDEALTAMEFLKPPPTEEHKDALAKYTGSAYGKINKYYRGIESSLSPDLKKHSEVLSEFLQAAPKVVAPTYRGMNFGDTASLNNMKAKLKLGGIFSDPGFMSTTYNKQVINGFSETFGGGKVLVTIEGKTGVLIEPFSGIRTEKEVLFNRNTKFKVKSYQSKMVKVPDTSITVEEISVTLVEI